MLSRLWTRCAQLGRLPTSEETLAARSVFKVPAWRLDSVTHTAERLTDCPLSLNGIAKGYIVERSCDAAIEHCTGISTILLNVGGDLRVRGEVARTIGIAAPWADSESSEPYMHIEVKDRSVATSGKSRRGFPIKDKWYSHVFDPRTGWPVERVTAATVVAERGADADALAKICGVLDPEESLRFVNSLPGVECLIFRADGQVAKTAGWNRLQRPRPTTLAMAQQRSAFARSGEGEPPGEPRHHPARTEPRPPEITHGHLDPSRSELKAPNPMRPNEEQKAASKASARPAWNKEFEVVVNFEINHPEAESGRYRRPYIAVWVEDSAGQAVRTLALWVSMGGSGPFQWLPDLKRWYKSDEERKLAEKTDIFFTIARPTRLPGTIQADLGRQGQPRQTTRWRRLHDLHRSRPRTRDLSEHPPERVAFRSTVPQGLKGQCRDPIRLDRISSQGCDKIVPRLRPSSAHARSLRRKLSIRFAKLMRWLHIYLSMFGLAAVLFFSVTGITLNHPNWTFGQTERRREAKGHVDLHWISREVAPSGPPAAAEPDPTKQVAKLEVVEHLRKTHGVRGALAEFRVDDTECLVSFKGPGYSADAFIDRDSGRYSLTELDHGLIALINDLHKGRDTGTSLVLGHRFVGRPDDGDFPDWLDIALLSQAQARAGRTGGRR